MPLIKTQTHIFKILIVNYLKCIENYIFQDLNFFICL
jgi:hypothetical protein